MSKNPITKLEQRKYVQEQKLKPEGFWYAFGDSWLKWVDAGMPHWKGDYLYVVNVNDSNILQLKTYEDLVDFSADYRGSSGLMETTSLLEKFFIDWPKLAKEYDGIEINPYIWEARFDMLWYYGWDVASGCVWNLSKVELENK